jgi:hypothetical protein
VTWSCARCRRPLSKEPVIVDGKGYGAACAAKVSTPDLLSVKTPRKPRKKRSRRERAYPDLFQEAAHGA